MKPPLRISIAGGGGVFIIEVSRTEESLILIDSDGKKVKVDGERAKPIVRHALALVLECARTAGAPE